MTKIVSIDGLPVYIISSGSTNICQGDSIKLKTNESGPHQWYFNNIPIVNATDTIYWAKTQGNYKVSVNNSNGCGTSGTIYITVGPNKPTVNWNGTSLNTVNGFSGYQWYLNGNAIPGATAPVYLPTTTGSYKVSINMFQCIPTSDEFNLNCIVVATPKPVVYWSG